MDRRGGGIALALAGGGTGGHVLPGISIAQAGLDAWPNSRFLFLGTDRPAERALFDRYSFAHLGLELPVPRRSPAGIVGFLKAFHSAFSAAGKALDRFRPSALLGLGGYASVPGVLAAFLRGVPVYLLEQNARLGAATRLLAPLAKRIFCGFDEGARRLGSRALACGNPLRAELAGHMASASIPGAGPDVFLFVVGGSQGAKGLNDLVAGAASSLSKVPGLRVVHLAGPDAPRMQEAWRRAGIEDAVALPFDPDVGKWLRCADLVVSRAGAMAVSEILAFGRPALFIPYPFAGGHQRDNAEPLARRGAAWMREERGLTGQALGVLLRGLLADREGLRRTGERARALASPRAAARVLQEMSREAARAGVRGGC